MLGYNMLDMVPGYRMYLTFLLGSLALSIGLQLLLPFPYGIGVALGLFIVFPMVARKLLANRMYGAGRFGGLEMGTKLEKLCMVCGKKEKNRECSRCGSHQFKVR
jgi:hypothetical protein